MNLKERVTRIRMWYHADVVDIICRITGRNDWINSKDDTIRRIIVKHVKKGVDLVQKLGYELSEEGVEFMRGL